MKSKRLKIMGKKLGMTQLFDEKGRVTVCTVIQAEASVIAQLKTKEVDGYEAIQLGFFKAKEEHCRKGKRFPRVSQPLQGHYKKAEVEPRKHLLESRVENSSDYKVGQEIGVKEFSDIEYVDVSAISKGKGFQGVIKRHGFAGGPASHGSHFHRSPGSTGMRSTPGRSFPGGKLPGQMGNKRVTVQGLKVVSVDVEKGLLILQGGVPGHNGALVVISQAVKFMENQG